MAGVAGTTCPTHTESWQTLPWERFQRNVFRLQQRIYQATRRGDWQRVHSLQRLLLRSWSARCLAVRQVTQDNRGKRTPGIDGVASLTPPERLALAETLRDLSGWTVDPIRRIYIPKPGKPEKRGLGIPTMRDRALQALVKLALEPEWEAQFEPNSYGFRPGRSAHDAIEAVFNFTCRKPKYVLDADIEKCFDRICHKALLAKLNTIQPVAGLIGAWLKAGIMDKGKFLFPEAGTPQGGVISPLLANVALHGFERTLTSVVSSRSGTAVIRYADDVVILHPDLEALNELRGYAEVWLAEMGLQLNQNKTRITHTLDKHEGNAGFDFLGFNIRQFRVGKYRTRTYRGKPGFKTFTKPSKTAVKRHLHQIRDIIRRHRGLPQVALIAALNPVIRGWSLYYRTGTAKSAFSQVDHQVYQKLMQWARRRHRNKARAWCYHRYWQKKRGQVTFSDETGCLLRHRDIGIVRHVKVRGEKSPYDGDWPYWVRRLGRDPTKPRRIIRLLKQEKGRCIWCGLCFTTEDVMEVHHWDGSQRNNRYANLALLHAHCHDQLHGKGCRGQGPLC
jgi:RNA-directed DNA polymerase